MRPGPRPARPQPTAPDRLAPAGPDRVPVRKVVLSFFFEVAVLSTRLLG